MNIRDGFKDDPPDKVVFVRLSYIIGRDGVLPISRSAFYKGIQSGLYPSPRRLGPRISVWPKNEIDALCAKINKTKGSGGS